MTIRDAIEQSGFGLALSLNKVFSKKNAGWLSGVLILASAGFAAAAVLAGNNIYFGWAEIFFALFIIVSGYWLFLRFLQSTRPFTIDQAKADWQQARFGSGLNFFAAKILFRSAKDQHLYLGDFFQALLREQRFLWVLKRLNISTSEFQKKIKEKYFTNPGIFLDEVLSLAWQKAFRVNHLHIRYPDLLAAVYDVDKTFQQVLFDFQVQEQDLMEVAYWQRRREKKLELQGHFWDLENLLNTAGIGKSWSGGFTVNLDKYATDLTAQARFNKISTHLLGRRKEIELLERLLVRGGSANVAIVGLPGAGRHTVIESLAQRINTGETYGSLAYSRLLQIDSGSILAGSASLNEVVARIETLFGEAYKAENVILVINNIDAFFDPHPEAGRVNATEALLPFLQSRLRVIGITTPEGYASTIGKNPQLSRLIAKLEIAELSPADTLLVLQDEVGRLEGQSGLFFTHTALKEIVSLSEKLIQNLPNPEKSLEIPQESAVYAANQASRVVLPEHVQKVVSTRTKVPVEKVTGEEKETLLNLESILHNRIIGQNQAIIEIANALRRARSGIRSEKRPIGSFLFIGPTGVGKTETTKALAQVYFGNEKNIIRFDMSEFQEVHSISRVIGDSDTKTGGLLTEAVIASPFSLLLFDEIEKAHPKILDLFLQILDDGRLTDAFGRVVSFVNTMIIATSNAGSEVIRQMVKDGKMVPYTE